MATAKREWKKKFLEAFGQTCNVTISCRAAGVSRDAYYSARERSKKFAAQADDARVSAVELLARRAWKMAEGGNEKLMMFLLKAHDPATYGDRKAIEHSGPGGGPIQIDRGAIAKRVDELLAGMTDEQVDALVEAIEKQ
ncbi:MAG: hypothetical protein WCS88_03980 [Patescibacteria group bacterium]|jgi:hypothetical protein